MVNNDMKVIYNEVRVYGKPISISTNSVKSFYSDRVARYDANNPLVTVINQDHDPELANKRDGYEKSVIIPLLHLNKNDIVLDLGCGIGRFADVIAKTVAHYHGVDAMEGLVNIAKAKFKDHPNISFQTLEAQDTIKENITYKSDFSLIIIANLLMYINDDDCKKILTQVTGYCADECRILITNPIGITERLTLNNIWSDELQCYYSAIYRTKSEYIELLFETIGKRGFNLIESQQLFPDELNNRKETEQHFFILQKENQETNNIDIAGSVYDIYGDEL